MFEEDDFLPLSALQHLLFCERRAILVHCEGLWAENRFTIEGHHLHERTDIPNLEVRGNIRIARGLYIRSLKLGLSGKMDVVEFHQIIGNSSMSYNYSKKIRVDCVILPGVPGLWKPFPVEYKRGKLRREEGYEIQLCAQALCLEEMLNTEVHAGAIFYSKTRKRLDVIFDNKLRMETETAVMRLHQLIREGKTPSSRYEKKCERCSLLDLCLPQASGNKKLSAEQYLAKAIDEAIEEG